MAQGLEVFNDNGVRQIGVHPTMELISSVSIPSSGWIRREPYRGFVSYTRVLTVTAPNTRCFLAVSGTSGGILGFARYSISGNTHSITVTAPTPTAGSRCTLHVIGPARNLASGFGLQVFDAQGAPLFNSSALPVSVSGVYPGGPRGVSSYVPPTYNIPFVGYKVLVPALHLLAYELRINMGGSFLNSLFYHIGFQFQTSRSFFMSPQFVSSIAAPVNHGGLFWNPYPAFPVFHVPE